MNRKAISLLAIFAMLCTMFTFAMPTIAEPTETTLNFPKYADHANYSNQKEWLIKDAADWKAVIATANSTSDTEYFKGVTFHLTDDVNFSQTEWLAPMGEGKYFSGTINGHGYGFNDLKIYEGSSKVGDAAADTESATGMFHRLGNCTFIDFGVNSGTVVRAAGGNKNAATTFGGLKNGYTPTFTRVWSGMVLRNTATGTVSALAATVDEEYTEEIKVNGFVYDGKTLSTVTSVSDSGTITYRPGYSMIGYLSKASSYRRMSGNLTYTNIISDAVMYTYKSGTKHPKLGDDYSLDAQAVCEPEEEEATGYYGAVFSTYSTAQAANSTFENLYGVSYPNMTTFFGRDAEVRTLEETKVAASAIEAAWAINQNPLTNVDSVYFTLKNGKVRPIPEGKDDERIVKVTLSGIKDEVYYLNADTEYDLEEKFGKNDLQNYELIDASLSSIAGGKLILGKENVTIEVTTECTHPNPDYKKGTNEHIKTCAICGFDNVEPCTTATYTINAISGEDLAAGEMATHSGTCQFCLGRFELECTVDYVPSKEANVESYWDYSECSCGREPIEHKDSAMVLSGDANGDSEIDLLDAVLLLKKVAQLEANIKTRNADVNGDNIIEPRDVLLVIRIWLENYDAIQRAKATQDRVNVENVYDLIEVERNKKFTRTGEVNSETGYLLTNPIEILEGEKIAFGPVRLSSIVMGYFFDEEGNPLELVNFENTKTEFTFEEGQAMVSVIAPKGAKSIRLQLTEKEEDQFYVRLNTEVNLMDYQKRVMADTEAITNPLEDKTVLTVGDSLCAALNDAPSNGLRGWARRIQENFGANVTNSAVGGSSMSLSGPLRETETAKLKYGSDKHYIYNQLIQHNGVKSFDYILLEGGVNDHRLNELYKEGDPKGIETPLGTFHPTSYDPADFDSEDTVSGGMERLIYAAIKEHGDTAAFGYLAPYEMRTSNGGFANAKDFLDRAMAICDKWKIPYVDFYNEPIEGFNPAKGAHTSDDCHALAEGYDLMQPRINDLCLRMRPVSQDIYNAVHQDRGIEGALNTIEENPYKDSLKILAIGNSFSQDATTYLWNIANSYGVDNVIVGNLKKAGCPLDLVHEYIVNDAAEFQYQTWTTANKGAYKPWESNVSVATALADEDWDIITIQQASDQNLVFDADGNKVDTYTKVDEILDYLQENEPNAKILWHMTWAYPSASTQEAFAAYGNNQLTMYHSLLDRARELTGKYEALEGVLPVGTAIQNLRDRLLPLGITEIAETGAGINRDGYHLNEGIGRYTAALTWYCYLTGSDPRAAMAVPDNIFGMDVAKYRTEIAESVLEAIQNPYDYREDVEEAA